MFGRKVDLGDRDEIARSTNYLRRIGMMQNLLPIHRQISYLLVICIGIQNLGSFQDIDENKPDADSSRERNIRYDARMFELMRISRIASLVDYDTRSLVRAVPWNSLDDLEAMSILDEPVPEFITDLTHRLIAAVPDLQAVIPDEETFIRQVTEQGCW